MEQIKPGDKVTFLHYGVQKTGTVARIGRSGTVFLTDGRWLHRESVQLVKGN